jgi:hypothetical protein
VLTSRYSSVDGSREYQLTLDLYRLKQEPDQTINDFFGRMQFLWDQLAFSDPAWKDPIDAQMYAEHRDQHRLYQLLMALHDDFEPVRGQLLFPLWTRLFVILFKRRLITYFVLSAHSAYSSSISYSLLWCFIFSARVL